MSASVIVYGVSTGETSGTGAFEVHSGRYLDTKVVDVIDPVTGHSNAEYSIHDVIVHQFFVVHQGELHFLDHKDSEIFSKQGTY